MRLLDFGYEHADMERTLHSFRYYPANAIRSSFLIRGNIDVHVADCFKFCFVRNPYGWYESFWRFMQDYDWSDFSNYRTKNRLGIPVDRWNPVSRLMKLADNDFNEFMRKVLNEEPAFLTKMYARYAPDKQINYIGKHETIIEDCLTVFQMLGYNVNLELFSHAGRVNESHSQRPIWKEKVKEMVYELEKSVFEKYGYAEDGSVRISSDIKLLQNLRKS